MDEGADVCADGDRDNRVPTCRRHEEPAPREIVGIVSDVRQFGLSLPPGPGMYVPLAQMADAQMAMFNRLSLPAARVRTMDEVFEASTASTAQNTWLMSAFAALALLVAVLGISAIAGYSVEQRRHELGVRLALGAQAPDVRRMVVWESVRVVMAGTVVGVLSALGLSGALAGLLFGVSRHDPGDVRDRAALLASAALAGAYLPARRASSLDPLVVLRE